METLKYSIVFSALLIFGVSSSFGQQSQYNWRVGVHTGLIGYYGDLSYKVFDVNTPLKNFWSNLDYFSYGISAEKSLTNAWGIRLSGTYGQFIAGDRSYNFKGELNRDNPYVLRGLDVKTDIMDLSFMFTYQFDNGRVFGERSFFTPYFMAGAGLTKFKTAADLFDDQGRPYYFWSDFTIRDQDEFGPDADMAVEIERDGSYETRLDGLRTEGVDYRTLALHLPVGMGFKFRLGDRINLNLETLVKYTTTDFLDDVSGDYLSNYDNALQQLAAHPGVRAGANRGRVDRRGDDMYWFSSLSLHYNFGRKKEAFRAPFIYPGSVTETEIVTDTSKTVVQQPEISIDTTNMIKPSIIAPDSVVIDLVLSPDTLEIISKAATSDIEDPLEPKVEETVPAQTEPVKEVSKSDEKDDLLIERLQLENERLRLMLEKANQEVKREDPDPISYYPVVIERDENDNPSVKNTQPVTTNPDNAALTGSIASMEQDMKLIKSLLIALTTKEGVDVISGIGQDKKQNEAYAAVMERLDELEKQINSTRISSPAASGSDSLKIRMLETQVAFLSSQLEALESKISQPAPKVETPSTPVVIPSPSAPEPSELTFERTFKGLELTNIYFKTNSSEIDLFYRDRLQRIGQLVSENDFLLVSITGYADPKGNPDYNLALSRKRAEAVKQFLMQFGFVLPDRILLQFYGASQSSGDPAFDRRVEVRLIRK